MAQPPIVVGQRPAQIPTSHQEFKRKLTPEDEREILIATIRGEDTIEQMLEDHDVYRLLREHFGDQLVDRWIDHVNNTWLDNAKAVAEDHCCDLDVDQEIKHALVFTKYPFVLTRKDLPDMTEAEKQGVADLVGPVCFWTLDDLSAWLVERGWLLPDHAKISRVDYR